VTMTAVAAAAETMTAAATAAAAAMAEAVTGEAAAEVPAAAEARTAKATAATAAAASARTAAADTADAAAKTTETGAAAASQKKPMLVVYSRGGGEKLIYIDANQRSDETEVQFPVCLSQNHYARATRLRTPANSIPEAAPAPPTNEDPTGREDTTADTTRGKRLRGDERQSAASSSPNDSLGGLQNFADV